MTTISVKDAAGATQNLEVPLTPGQKTMALSRPIAIASDQSNVPVHIDPTQVQAPGQTNMAGSTSVAVASDQSNLPVIAGGNKYLACPAGATTALGTGAIGDYIEELLCIVGTPATSLVQIKDGSGAAMDVLPNNVASGIGTIPLPIGYKSVIGGWSVITGAGVKVIANGKF